jgi:predicted nucleic acid-binding protein
MIAIDTSSWIAFLEGDAGTDCDLVARALADRQVVLPPVVLTELLSDSKLPARVRSLLIQIPHLDVLEGYWERAGTLRAKLVRQKRKAPLADTLIAQSCLDHDVALVTRDADFRNFAGVSGLRVLLESASS